MDQNWVNGYQVYVYSILRNIIFKEERLRSYTDPEAMKIWIRAVTDVSVNPVSNYEDLEALGDFILKGTFVAYLVDRYPGIDKERINNINSFYMREGYQKKLAPMIGLDKWARTEKVTPKTYEDTFEAFVGALYTISKMKESKGRGYTNCYNLIAFIFRGVEINYNVISDPKGFVQQTISRFSLGDVKEVKNNDTYQLEISDKAMKFFANRGISLRSNIIGVARKNEREDKKATLARAYANAMNTFFAAGITREWIEKEHENWDKSLPQLAPYIEKATEVLKSRGMKRMYFEIPQHLTSKGDNPKKLVMLVGINTDTLEEFTLGTVDTEDVTKGKVELVKRLAESTI